MTDLIAGGVYSVLWDGDFRVVKVLAVDESVVHLKIYRNRFEVRPSDVDISALKWDIDMDDLSNIGIGHIPVSLSGFLEEKPTFIRQEMITPEELEAVNNWRYGDEDA